MPFSVVQRQAVVKTVVISIALVAAAACGSSDSPEEPAAPSPISTTSVPAVADSGVTLEDAGVEPRQPLSLRLRPETTTTAALESKIGVDMTVDGQQLPIGAVPGTRFVFEERIDSLDRTGPPITR